MQPKARRIAGSIAIAILVTLFGGLIFRLIEGPGEQPAFGVAFVGGLIIGYSCWPNVERAWGNRRRGEERVWLAKAAVWVALPCGLLWLLNRLVQPTGVEGFLLAIIALVSVGLAASGANLVWSRLSRGTQR